MDFSAAAVTLEQKKKPSLPQKALAQLPNQKNGGLKPQVYLLKIVLQSPTLTLWVLPQKPHFSFK